MSGIGGWVDFRISGLEQPGGSTLHMKDALPASACSHCGMSLADVIPIAVFGGLMLALWLLRNSPYSSKARNQRKPHSFMSDWKDPMD
jgi:hypothetical protein